MAKYVYPAIFTKEATGGYSVGFPDFGDDCKYGCSTQGKDLNDALFMANDALCLTLYDMEESGEVIPKSSDISLIKTDKAGDFVSLVSCDTEYYRKFYEKKAVRKTLTIPAYLNVMAERENINFSQVLQEALKQRFELQ
ncbi:MAG: type II toxin-antitoxin system HicB family antitoxin [Firmicutes bacterium]|nr:type II toxin-antitoxin system HicB family antitoxin [Bacillota bacterium]